MMFLTRPLQFLAVAAGAGSMMLAVLSSTAQAERPTYRNISHGGSSYHACPCPCPSGDAAAVDPDQVPTPTPEEGEDLPEVADLTSDSGFASASQSAVPNAIGDSTGGCYSAFASGIISISAPVCTSVRNFRIAENNSALPQHRLYYNYNYFNNSLRTTVDGEVNDIDVQRHEFGFEYPFWCDMASVGVEVPFSHTLSRNIDTAAADINLRDVEFENISVYLKAVLYQDCCKTYSAGLGIDLPTADDIAYSTDTNDFILDNDVVVLSPYLAMLHSDPCGCMFFHAFAQVDIPTDDYGIDFNGDVDEIDGATLLHLDASVGYWLQRDCCGNGIAAIAELHWTNNLSGNDVVVDGANSISLSDFELLNATVGANIANGCWDIRPAVVLPLLDRPDRAFDWEFALQVNRRF